MTTTQTASGLMEELRRAVATPCLRHGLAEVESVLVSQRDRLERLVPPQAERAPGKLTSHLIHAEAEFSVVALVLPPATNTTVHDHLTWCAVAVIRGVENETTYEDLGDYLEPVEYSTNAIGSVSVLIPPGDIHQVRNDADTTAISIHVYGTDLRLVGSSVRRTYDLPVRASLLQETR